MVSRAEHRRTTLLTLGSAAVELFEQHGPAVTIDAIAERAGVSRRTIFRYVDGKEELAFVHPILWFDVFDRALDDAESEPLADRLRIASQAIAAVIDLDPEPPRRAFIVAAANPQLLRGFNAVYQRWVDRVARAVADDPMTGDDPFRARIVGSAVMGMVDAVTRQWVMSPPEVTYAEVCTEGYEALAPLFTAASQQRQG